MYIFNVFTITGEFKMNILYIIVVSQRDFKSLVRSKYEWVLKEMVAGMSVLPVHTTSLSRALSIPLGNINTSPSHKCLAVAELHSFMQSFIQFRLV